jgi:hypothetical protein
MWRKVEGMRKRKHEEKTVERGTKKEEREEQCTEEWERKCKETGERNRRVTIRKQYEMGK